VTRASIDSWLARPVDANDNKNITVQNDFIMSKRCFDVVESRVEQAILDAESPQERSLTSGSE